MAKYLLDTNHASPLVTLGHPLRDRMLEEHDDGHEFCIAVPALAELWFALLISQRVLRNLEEWTLLERKIECLALDEADAKSAASLQKVLEDVAHYYEVPLELDPAAKPLTQKINITVRFENQPLEQALDEIRLITGLSTKKEKDKIVFYQK